MLGDERLCDFPYVRVRLVCDECRRRGSYRLARLAAKYGAEIRLDELIEKLSADCGHRRIHDRRGGHDFHCQARFADLTPPRPNPDLPPDLVGLRILDGGKR